MSPAHFAAVAVVTLGCVTDLFWRRIPNGLTFSAALVAFGFHFWLAGWLGVGASVLGMLVGLGMFLPFFALGGLGGGDVKLMAALGAWLGPSSTVWLALWAMIAGGPVALIIAASRGYARQAIQNFYGLLMFWRVAGLKPHPAITLEGSSAPRVPYAFPIAAGLAVTLWLR